jgi:tetratricopeptide (TPR) repeat protein
MTEQNTGFESLAAPLPPPLHETLQWLLKIEDFETVRCLALTAARFMPSEDPSATDYIAAVLHKSKHYRDAVRYAAETVRMLPDSAEARFNAAKCFNSAGSPAEAERHVRVALAQRPGWLDAKLDLAVYISSQGRFEEAARILESLLQELPPDSRDVDVVNFNLGWHRVRQGRFKEGMAKLSIGRKLKIWGARSYRFEQPELRPATDLRGKVVLICGEGGAGDEMIAARFGQTIRDRGGEALFFTAKPLASLLSRVPGLSGVVAADQVSKTRFDYWAPGMDLVQNLGLDLSEIPNRPYVSADPAYVQRWRERLPGGRALKVGIRWQGNPLYEAALMRSVPFKLLESLADIPGVELYSLQRDAGSEERPADSPVKDLGPLLRTWEDTAAAIENLDLVISSCTSIPHLAAAMGKPTWILPPLNSYYIWATPGDRSAWYASVRLFRQRRLDDWEEPIRNVRSALEAVVAGRTKDTPCPS